VTIVVMVETVVVEQALAQEENKLEQKQFIKEITI
jgi:hypothetical protein